MFKEVDHTVHFTNALLKLHLSSEVIKNNI